MYTQEMVLAWVNAERKAHGYGPPLDALPRGIICDAYRCPIAQSFPVGTVMTDGSRMWFTSDMETPYELPEYIHEFVQDFDAGHIPELVREKEYV